MTPSTIALVTTSTRQSEAHVLRSQLSLRFDRDVREWTYFLTTWVARFSTQLCVAFRSVRVIVSRIF